MIPSSFAAIATRDILCPVGDRIDVGTRLILVRRTGQCRDGRTRYSVLSPRVACSVTSDDFDTMNSEAGLDLIAREWFAQDDQYPTLTSLRGIAKGILPPEGSVAMIRAMRERRGDWLTFGASSATFLCFQKRWHL